MEEQKKGLPEFVLIVKAKDLVRHTFFMTNEKEKSKKQFKLLDAGKITRQQIEHSYQSWKSHAASGNSYHLIRETDQLFQDLLKRSE